MNATRLRAILFVGALALTPAVAMAQTSSTPGATSQAAAPTGGMPGGGMDHGKMMGGEQKKDGLAAADCNGKPCGPPQGTPGPMGGMPMPNSTGSTNAPGGAAGQPATSTSPK
jgi:hypothetical protein